jgi:hypothetical protein
MGSRGYKRPENIDRRRMEEILVKGNCGTRIAATLGENTITSDSIRRFEVDIHDLSKVPERWQGY